MSKESFCNLAIVACGTLSLEINHLREEGFLDTDVVLYTTPGLHENPRELERQLVDKIQSAKEKKDKVLVVYGGKFCYINSSNPMRTMQTILEEQGPNVARINATHCMDMIASEEERKRIALEMTGDEKIWWMVPGWIKFRKNVFYGWDKGLANENFPRHTGGAIVLDAVGFTKQYIKEKTEELFEYSDWMGIPIQPATVALDRFKGLLLEQVKILNS